MMLVILFLPKGLHDPLVALVRKLEEKFRPTAREPAAEAPLGPSPIPVAPPPVVRSTAAAPDPLLEVRGLSKSFGGLVAVQDFDLAVADGEILGLIGPNGAGKTTVFNMVACYFPPDAGDVLFQGRSLIGLRPHQACALGSPGPSRSPSRSRRPRCWPT
jgi:ABC-type glutathione transport system ATPase component